MLKEVIRMYNLGARLAALRKQKGWTQKQLAQYLYKSTSAISSYERNNQTPPADVLICLADLYHVSIDGWLGLSHDDTITTRGLSQKEKDTVLLLLDEFHNPSGDCDHLSQRQCEIIDAVLRLFTKH